MERHCAEYSHFTGGKTARYFPSLLTPDPDSWQWDTELTRAAPGHFLATRGHPVALCAPRTTPRGVGTAHSRLGCVGWPYGAQRLPDGVAAAHSRWASQWPNLAHCGRLHGPPGRQMGGTWPQGTPRAGGLRRGPGGAALCLTSADIDPRAPISSPMGGARGLLRNPKVRWLRLAPGGSMDQWARPYVESPSLYTAFCFISFLD